MDDPIRVVVLADDPLARAGLAALLSTLPGYDVIFQGSGEYLTESALALHEIESDIIIWDLGWGTLEIDPEEFSDPNVPIIALVKHEDQVPNFGSANVRGLLWREVELDILSAGISAVIAGLTVTAPGLSLSTSGNSMLSPGINGGVDLTFREHEVLALMVEGMTNKAIGHRLSISEHTVKFHVNAIMSKLDAQSRTDAVVRATRLGLISL